MIEEERMVRYTKEEWWAHCRESRIMWGEDVWKDLEKCPLPASLVEQMYLNHYASERTLQMKALYPELGAVWNAATIENIGFTQALEAAFPWLVPPVGVYIEDGKKDTPTKALLY